MDNKASVKDVNGWTDYAEKIGNDLYVVSLDGYGNYHIEIHENDSLFPTSRITVGFIERAEKILDEARNGAEPNGWLNKTHQGHNF